MEDVAQLCPRVIVIDQGKLVYDGALGRARLADTTRQARGLPLRAQSKDNELSTFGKVVRHSAAESVLDVHKDAVNRVITQALATLPVTDLTVESPPLEEVMSELFARGREARTRPKTEGDTS